MIVNHRPDLANFVHPEVHAGRSHKHRQQTVTTGCDKALHRQVMLVRAWQAWQSLDILFLFTSVMNADKSGAELSKTS
jgi:hypothetical protein